jgi:agmatine/peptidylarginine deiminase
MGAAPVPWTTQAIAHSKLLRPYSPRRFSDALYHVTAAAAAINGRHTALLLDMPADPDAWRFELAQLRNELETLAESCHEAWERLWLLDDQADGDYQRAIDAMALILGGMSEPVAA